MKMKKLLSFLLMICMLMSVIIIPQSITASAEETQNATIINAADYGVTPGAQDNAEGIKTLLSIAKAVDGPVVISFPKGEYQIYPDKAYKKELYISNTVGQNQNYKMKNIGFLFEDMHDVTIEGNGSMFMFHGAMITFATIDSTNITFQNFETDFKTPSVIDVNVEAVDGNTATIYVPECFDYEINGTTITWKCDPSPYTGNPYWTRTNAATNNMNQIYDSNTGITTRPGSIPLFNNLSSIEDLGNNRLKFTYSNIPTAIKTGLCYQMRDPTRDHASMFFWKSENITLSHINAYFLYGFGIEGQHSTNITIDTVNLAVPEGSGRTSAGFADFIHMSGCKGEIRVQNCFFSNPHDDPINVHGTFNKVVERISDRKFKVRFMHHETAGFPNYFVGDEVEFLTASNMIPVENSVAKVVEVQGPTGDSGASNSGTGSLTDIIITLDRDIPAEITANTHVVENITYTPSLIVENCIFEKVPTRGILVTTRKKVEIRNNIFDGMSMASIYISNDAQNWWESGAVRDVTIEGNTFLRPSERYGAIFIEPTNPTVSREKQIHENIRILNNKFYMQNGQVLNAKCVKNLTFTGNEIYRYDPQISLELQTSSEVTREGKTISLLANGSARSLTSNLYYFNGCKNVILDQNTYDGGLKLNATTSNMDNSDVNVGADEGVVVNGNANVLPAMPEVHFESSDENVLTIAPDGTATGVNPGTVTVKAFVQLGDYKYESNEITVTVVEASSDENNAYLSKLETTGGLSLDNVFDGQRLNHTGTASSERVSMNLEAEQPEAEIEVIADGVSVAKRKGSVAAELPMHGGINEVYIRVTSPNGETENLYKLDIAGQKTVYLSDMDYDDSKTSSGYGPKAVMDRSTDNNPLTLRKEDGTNQVFEKGVGSHATCNIVYDISGLGFKTFTTYVGVDQEIVSRDQPSMKFRIYGDGELLYETGEMNADTPMEFISVSVDGISELKLTADALGVNWSDHADFADAKLLMSLPESTPVYTVRYESSIRGGADVSARVENTETANGFIGASEGKSVVLTANVQDGYEFVAWQDADGNVCSTETTLTVDNIQESALYTAVVKKSVPTALLGDVDHSEEVDATDATLVLQYYAGIIGADSEGFDISVADVNTDTQIDAADATLILQLYSGIITEF